MKVDLSREPEELFIRDEILEDWDRAIAQSKQDAASRKKKRRLGQWITFVLITVLVATGTIIYKSYRDSFTIVPQAVLTYNKDACEPFVNAGLKCEVKQVTNSSIPLHGLIKQSIAAETEVKKDSSVELRYSLGLDNLISPEILNRTVEELQEDLAPYNITVLVTGVVDRNDMAEGRIAEANITKGSLVSNGSVIEVKTATGIVTIPDWTGETQDTVTSDATNFGIIVEFEEVESDELPGTVIKQDKKGELSNSEIVTVTIAGKKIVDEDAVIPDVIGLTEVDAQSLLALEGFTSIDIVKNPDAKKHEIVEKITPNVGEETPNTTIITLTLGGE